MDTRISFLSLLIVSAVALAVDKVPITIYFESLCPDSKNFTAAFTKVYETSDVKDHITPDYIPYGKFNSTANTCQHGHLECEGNIILGCANHHMNDTDKLVKFVGCIMGLDVPSNSTAFPLEKCNTIAGDTYGMIKQCWNGNMSEEGKKFNEEYKTMTNNFFTNDTKFEVPWVVYNHTKDADLNKKMQADLLGVLCNQLKTHNLKACEKSSGSSLTASLLPALLAAFVLARL